MTTINGLLTVREAARRLGVHENTVRNWADSGYLKVAQALPPARRKKSAARRFDPNEVEKVRKKHLIK